MVVRIRIEGSKQALKLYSKRFNTLNNFAAKAALPGRS